MEAKCSLIWKDFLTVRVNLHILQKKYTWRDVYTYYIHQSIFHIQAVGRLVVQAEGEVDVMAKLLGHCSKQGILTTSPK